MKGLLLVLAVLVFAMLPRLRRRSTIRQRASLQVCDFKDRRNERQRSSYGSIAAARQAMADQKLIDEWARRVRTNECNRIAKKLVGVPAVSAREA